MSVPWTGIPKRIRQKDIHFVTLTKDRTSSSSNLDQVADTERALDRDVDDGAGGLEVLADGRTRALTVIAHIDGPVLVDDIAETDRRPVSLGEELRRQKRSRSHPPGRGGLLFPFGRWPLSD